MHLLLPRSSITFSYVDCTYLQEITSTTLDINPGILRALIDTWLLGYSDWRIPTVVSAARLPTERMLYGATIGISLMYLPTGGKTEKSTPSIINPSFLIKI